MTSEISICILSIALGVSSYLFHCAYRDMWKWYDAYTIIEEEKKELELLCIKLQDKLKGDAE